MGDLFNWISNSPAVGDL